MVETELTGLDVCVCVYVCLFEKEGLSDNVHVQYNYIDLVSPPPDLQEPVGSWGHCASFISTNEPVEQVRPRSLVCVSADLESDQHSQVLTQPPDSGSQGVRESGG